MGWSRWPDSTSVLNDYKEIALQKARRIAGRTASCSLVVGQRLIKLVKIALARKTCRTMNTHPVLDPESAVKQRYAAAAKATEPRLCCAVNYYPNLLKIIPTE